jgi:putative lipoic acid-binding regulatory protein
MIEISGKPDISYPTNWGYKIIGLDEMSLRKSIDEVLEKFEYNLQFSKKSSKGKFISLNLNLIVQSEEERDLIFNKLKNSPNIKMVI